MKARYIIALHLLLLLYSCSTILSKLAAGERFFRLRFLLLYGGMALILLFYAIFWQQLLKKVPLIFAYANKAVTVIWGLVFGILIFGEESTIKKIAGVLLVGLGIVLYSKGAANEQK